MIPLRCTKLLDDGARCAAATTHYPQLTLRVKPALVGAKAPLFGLGLCPAHAAATTRVDQVMGEDAWSALNEAFTRQRFPLPRKELTTVELVEVQAAQLVRRFYVAGRLSSAARVRGLAEGLKERGHVQTYDWTTHGSVEATPELFAQTAVNEAVGVMEAQTVIVLLPGGYGTHVELGMAIAAGKQVILIGRHDGAYPCVFHRHPGVTWLEVDWAQLSPEGLTELVLEQL